MSARKVDERVVEMRFDNANFEKNVSTTMSTLDKLKNALTFKGASKGLEQIQSAASKVNFSGMASSIETVQARFTSLQVVAATVLANITNAAVNAGKSLVSSFTIQPLLDGWREYELQMNSVQTILANTQSKGTTINDVTDALAELNEYADQTIYNFGEMTRNIGTFTAAGVDLDKATAAIKGIANLGAMSGSTSTQVSSAMYQLSQALATGRVSLLDWNSVVNAGMGGEQFQEALKRTARHMGTDVDSIIDSYGSFRESLTEGKWLTADILTETLNQISGAYTEADLIAQGYTEDQAKAITQMAKTATDAATKVKTFTQLMSTLSEAAGSGWATTWQTIFGDFEQAKEFFTELSDYFGDIIGASADTRNALVSGAFDSGYEKLSDILVGANGSMNEFESNIRRIHEATGATGIDALIEEYGSLNNAIMAGKISWETVKQAFEETGKDSEKLNEYLKENNVNFDELYSEMNRVSGRKLFLDGIVNILKAMIEPLRAVGAAFSDVFGIGSAQLYGMLEGFNKFSEGLKNMLANDEQVAKITSVFRGLFGVLHIFTSLIGGAFSIAFNVLSAVLSTVGLSVLDVLAIVGDLVYGFSEWLTSGEAVVGVMNAIQTVIGFVLAPFQQLISLIASLPAVQGAMTSLSNFFSGIVDAFKSLQGLDPATMLATVVDKVKSFAGNITWEDILGGLRNLGSFFGDLYSQAAAIGPDIIAGFQQGVSSAIGGLIAAAQEIGTKIIQAVKAVLGIASPSTEFFAMGEDCITGFLNGLKNVWDQVASYLKGAFEGLVNVLGGIDWGRLFVVGTFAVFGIGIYKMAKQISEAVSILAEPLQSLGGMFDALKGTFNAVSGYFGQMTKNLKSEAILNYAKAIGILAASIAILALIGPEKIIPAVAAIAVLAGLLVAMTAIVNKIAQGSTIELAKLSGLMLSFAVAFGVLTIAAMAIANMPVEGLAKVAAALGVFAAVMAILIGISGKFSKATALTQMTKMIAQLSAVMLLLAVAIGIMSIIPWDGLLKAAAGMTMFGIFIAVMNKIASGGKSVNRAGSVIRNMSTSLVLLAVALGIMAVIPWDGFKKMAVGIVGLIVVMAGLALISKIKGMQQVPATLLILSASLLILAVAVGIMGTMKPETLQNGIKAVAYVAIIAAMLVAATAMAGKGKIAQAAVVLLAMSVSIGILAGVAVLLSLMDPSNLARGIAAVAVLSVLIAGLVAVTTLAKDCYKDLIVITVAIGILVAAVVVLSFIDPGKLAGATAAMAVLMGMFALIVGMTHFATSSLSTLLVITAAIGILGGIIYLLSSLPIESTLATAAALSMLLASMSVAMLILGKIGTVSPTALAAVGIIAGVIAILAVIFGVMSALDIQPNLETALALSTLLLALSAALVILGAVGSVAPAAIAGAGALVAVAGILTAAIMAFGAIAQIPGAQWLVSEGGDFLQSIGNAIGQFVGGIAGGFLEGATASLPQAATSLSEFMENLGPFLQGASSITPEMGEGIKNLAAAILILTGANLVEQLTAFLGGGSSLADFGEQLVPFGESLAQFGASIEGINPDAFSAAAQAAQGLADLAASLPKEGGLAQAIFGETVDMETFGTQMVAFGKALVEFSSTVSGGIDAAAIQDAATAGQALSDLAEALPKENGLAQAIFGESGNLETFGAQMKAFGQALVDLSTGMESVTLENVQKAVDAGNMLNELQTALSGGTSGGVIEFFTGQETGLETFGNDLKTYGTALSTFGSSIADVDFSNISTATTVSRALMNFIESTEDFDASGLSNFADVEDLGDILSTYSSSIASVNVSNISASVSAIQELVNTIKSMAGMDTSGVALFKSAVNELATINIGAVVAAFTAAAAQLVSVGILFMQSLASGMMTGASLTIAAATMISLLIAATFTALNPQFMPIGLELMTYFILGIESAQWTLVSTLGNLVSYAASSTRSYYSSFYSAGYYVALGFAAGISAGTFMAAARARAMASAAASAARSELNEQSPSKVFAEIGEYAGLGFVNGLAAYEKASHDQGEAMGKSAVSGAETSMRLLSDLSNFDLDTAPTITPVVDLSNVAYGVAAINAMLTGLGANTALSQVGAINRTMTSRNQNGTFDDVVNAVDRVRMKLNDLSQPSYTVNGITYEDGTAVSSAIRELVRVTNIERRV